MVRIGVISDTHGKLRPEALQALGTSDLILHAGDIGRAEVIEQLQSIAPVHAVRGNVDRGAWAQGLPLSRRLAIEQCVIHMLHDIKQLDLDPVATGVDVVVCGHSHAPRAERRDGVLYFNPGSAGPRRFRLPVALGRLEIDGRRVRHAILELRLQPR